MEAAETGGALGTQVKFTDCRHDHIRWILYHLGHQGSPRIPE